nr:zinc finger protein 260-like [Leptinotarsa decemlineata]
MENSRYEELCRICATRTSMVLSINIFGDEGTLRQISKKLDTCLPIQVHEADELPKMICENCLYKLELFCDFRDRSARTERILLELFKEISSSQNESLHACLVPMNDNDLMMVQHHHLLNNQNVSDLDLSTLDQREGMVAEHEVINLNQDIHSHSMDSIINNHSLSNQDYSNQSLHTQDSRIDAMNVQDSKFPDNFGLIQHHQLLTDQFRFHHDLQLNMAEGNSTNISLSNNADSTDRENQRYNLEVKLQCENICNLDYEETKLITTNSSNNEVKMENYKQEDSNSRQSLPTDEQIHDGTHNCNNLHEYRNQELSSAEPTTQQLNMEHYKHEDSNSRHSLPVEEQLNDITSQNSVEDKQVYNFNDNSDPMLILHNNKDWYYCNICGKSYDQKVQFDSHYGSHFYNCPGCSTVFTNQEVLNSHRRMCIEDPKFLNTKHKNDEVSQNDPASKSDGEECETKCDISQIEVDDAAGSDDSKKKKNPPKQCKECGKTYKTNYKLTEHMRKHTGEKPYKCRTCEKAFRSKIGLAQHEAKHTGQYDFSCPTCGKGFQCKSYLMVHQRVHSNIKPYPCTTCGRNFKTKQSLLDHTNRHLGVKPYVCDICGRGFITKGLCRAHRKIHSGLDNRKYSCKICDKMFVSKSYLQTHLRIHTGEKPFMCEVCGKGFLTGVDLKIHSTMHTGEKSFICEMCGKAFARRDALRCHRRSHTGERPYSCDLCGQTFTQFTPMAIHKRLHTGERPYPCETCGKAFVSRSTMMSHAKKHVR